MRPFTDVLRDMRRGWVVEEASQRLAEVVIAVQETGKAGKIALELTVKPQSRGDNAVILSAKVAMKKPQADMPEAVFFADSDGSLLRDDPTQMRMFADAKAGDGDRYDPKTGEVFAADA